MTTYQTWIYSTSYFWQLYNQDIPTFLDNMHIRHCMNGTEIFLAAHQLFM